MVLEVWEGFGDGRLDMGGKKRVSSDSERGYAGGVLGNAESCLCGCCEQRRAAHGDLGGERDPAGESRGAKIP